MEHTKKPILSAAVLTAGIVLLAYGFFFQRYVFIHVDAVTLIRCSTITGNCNYFTTTKLP